QVTNPRPTITSTDADLDDEVYTLIEKALADLNLSNLNGRVITREEINALTPFVAKICGLAKSLDSDDATDQKKKIDLFEKLEFFGVTKDVMSKNLLKHDITELHVKDNTLVCAKRKASKGTLSKMGHKVAKFWKKHKKAIIITAAVVAAIVAVAVVAPAIG